MQIPECNLRSRVNGDAPPQAAEMKRESRLINKTALRVELADADRQGVEESGRT